MRATSGRSTDENLMTQVLCCFPLRLHASCGVFSFSYIGAERHGARAAARLGVKVSAHTHEHTVNAPLCTASAYNLYGGECEIYAWSVVSGCQYARF